MSASAHGHRMTSKCWGPRYDRLARLDRSTRTDCTFRRKRRAVPRGRSSAGGRASDSTPSFTASHSAQVDRAAAAAAVSTYPYSGNGYHYEADEVRACIERGVTESGIMPLNESIAVASRQT